MRRAVGHAVFRSDRRVVGVRFWPSGPGSARTFTTDEIAEALVELARQAVGAD